MADFLREIRILKFLQIITLVVLLFLSLAVLAQASPVKLDKWYEACYTSQENLAKSVILGNYKRVEVKTEQVYNEEVSFTIKHVNRIFYANQMKLGDHFELPQYDFVVTGIDEKGNDKISFCFAERRNKITNSENKLVAKNKISDADKDTNKKQVTDGIKNNKKDSAITIEEINGNAEDSTEEITEGIEITETQNPKKESIGDLFLSALTTQL